MKINIPCRNYVYFVSDVGNVMKHNSEIFQNFSQIAAIFIAAMTILNEGLLLAWPSPAVPSLTNPNHPLKFTMEESTYFTILPSVTFILTTVPYSFIVNKIGRKKTLILATVPYMISGVLLSIGQSKWIYYAGRLLQGLGTSASYNATPLYCGEVATPKVRGKWGNLMTIEYFLGILITLVVGSYFDLLGMGCTCVAIPVINLLLLLCIPESPYYLIKHGKQEDAKTSLQWLRQREDVHEELIAIENAVYAQTQTSSSFKDIILVRNNRKALIAMFVIRLLQQSSGISAVIIYSHTFFEMAGGNLSPSTSAILCGTVQLAFAVPGAIIVHKYGRRVTLFTSAIGSNILFMLLAIYFYINVETDVDMSFLSWFPIAGMVSYLIVYSVGLSSVPTLLSAELFSASVKEKSIAIHNMLFGLLIALTSKIFQVLAEYGLYVPLLFFAVMCSLMTGIGYFVVPETKGKTLDEIQQAFGAKPNKDNRRV